MKVRSPDCSSRFFRDARGAVALARSSPNRCKRARPNAAWVLLAGLTVILAAFPSSPLAGEKSEMAELRQQIKELKRSYEERIRALEARIDALETEGTTRGGAKPSLPKTGNGDLESLRAAARRAAGAVAPARPSGGAAPVESAPMAATVGHERNLNRLNPEISFTGDALAVAETPDTSFDFREFELDLRSALDPFSSTRATLSFEDGNADVEEAYVTYSGLAAGVSLRAGKMRQSFGILNRYHQHALPQVEYPLVLRKFFGEEGLDQTGASIEWLLPRPWASANEITVQVTDGASEPFGAGTFRRLVTMAHLKNYWDVSPSTYVELGLSGIGGRSAPSRDTFVWGSDFTVHWQPPSRAKYREITWRTEGLLSQRDDLTGRRRDAWGLYSYVEGLLHRNLYAGIRYDWVEEPLDPADEQWRLSPYMTWWQSEFVRLRGEYQIVRDVGARRTDHRMTLQLTWAAGPHKHENY